MNQQKAFNIQEYVAICKNKKKLLAGIVAGFAVVSLAAGLVWPKTYESTTTVRTRMTPGSVTSGSALATLAGLSGAGTPTMTYVELMKSGVVLQPIIDKLDWDEDEKKFLTPDKFAKKNLTIESIKQTNIITVSAKGNTPEEAQMIADDVVNNFMHLMTDM
ncbi:MAG: Wzz/FepE/Etk N-terminal domain-containing protein, partial [Veillonella caviae]|nr:Wzz/FepE/Etk N-terminal domain-containing protein [Veillonella caviae]